MSSTTISKTVSSTLRRQFAAMPREQAVALFNQVLDSAEEPSAAHELVSTALESIYDRNLRTTIVQVGETETRSQVGAVLGRKELTEQLTSLLGDSLEPAQLKSALADVLAGPDYEGVLGQHGGYRRLRDPQAPAKPAPKKRAPKAAPAAE